MASFGCGVSYPKEKVLDSVKEVCKKEYGVDVKVKAIGETIGVLIPMERLFEVKIPSKPGADPAEIIKGIQFSKDAARQVDHVVLTISRVTMSSNADFKFYVVIARDEGLTGVELVITRYIYDLKRLLYGDISRGEFIDRRMQIDIRISAQSQAQWLAQHFFQDLSKSSINEFLNRYFPGLEMLPMIPKDLIIMLGQKDLKEELNYTVEKLSSIQISPNTVLVWARVREDYRPKKGLVEDFVFPAGFSNEYLFVIKAQDFKAHIARIYLFFYKDQDGQIKKTGFPARFLKYQDIAVWEKDFYLEEIKVSDFLAQQIARRIRMRFYIEPSLSRYFDISTCSGTYDNNDKMFRFDLNITAKAKEQDIDKDELYKNVMPKVFELISNTLQRYNFKDFKYIEVHNAADGSVYRLTREELIKKYRRRSIIQRY